MRIENPRRSWKTAVVALVATLVAGGTARASTTVFASQKTISDTASAWTQTKTEVGKFGAGYTGGYSLTEDGLNQSGEADAGASVEVFGQTVNLLTATATAGTEEKAHLTITALGGTLYDQDFGDPTGFSITESIPMTFLSASDTVVIVVVPVTISAKLAGSVGMTVSGSIKTDSDSANLSIKATPSASTTFTLSAGVGVTGANVSLSTSITILSLSLPLTYTLAYFPNAGDELQYSITQNLTIQELDGKLDLVVTLFTAKWKKTLIEWTGLDQTVLLFTDDTPEASDPEIDIQSNGYQATVDYVYTDAGGRAESGTVVKWNVLNGDTEKDDAAEGQTVDLIDLAGQGQTIQACVTPDNGVNAGETVCSAWTNIAPVLFLLDDHLGGAPGPAFAWAGSPYGTCFEVPSTFNDLTSQVQATGGADPIVVVMYQDAHCSGATWNSGVIGAGVTKMIDLSGGSHDNALSSFEVVRETAVGVTDVAVDVDGATATGTYTFGSDGGFSESGSSYLIERADDASGTNETQLATTKSWALTTSDGNKYLRFCITPSDGYVTGDEVCSDWTSVGRLLKLWDAASYTGTNVNIAYQDSPSGTCFNLTDDGFNDVLSSLKMTAWSDLTTHLHVFTDVDCSGSEASAAVAAGGSLNISNVGSQIGSGFNNSISSVKVTW